jgi:predicted dehydrogenase
MPEVKIGFVGVGSMGQNAHLKNYAAIPGCEVVALAEVREELGKKVAAKYGVPRVYKDYEEMFANEKLDGIVSAQPFTRHGTIVPELLKWGIPLLTEKPLAGSIEIGEKILDALKRSQSFYMVGYHKRSDPATMYAKQIIDEWKQSGKMGRLRYVRILIPSGDWVAEGFNDLVSTTEGYPSLQWDEPASDMDKETNDQYISFVNYYIHQINLMRHLLGEPYHVVFADKSGILMVVESEQGISGTIEMSPYRTTIDWKESFIVGFDHGYIQVELPAPLAVNRPGKVEIFEDPGNECAPITTIPTLHWVHAMRQQAINFVSAIKGEMKPICEAPEALEDLKNAREYIRLFCGK